MAGISRYIPIMHTSTDCCEMQKNGHPFLTTLSGVEVLWESLCGDVQSICVLKDGLDPFQITESKSGANVNVNFHFY